MPLFSSITQSSTLACASLFEPFCAEFSITCSRKNSIWHHVFQILLIWSHRTQMWLYQKMNPSGTHPDILKTTLLITETFLLSKTPSL